MCSETSPPRLSFSHDLGQADVLPFGHNQPRKDSSLLDFNCDFEFSISSSFRDESSSADELFSHGVILPKQPRDRPEDAPKRKYNGELAKHSNAPLPPLSPFPNSPQSENSKKDNMKEELVKKDSQNDSLEEQKPPSKSFWGFKRSISLNQENKKSLLCSLQLLSRSNSTGSAPNPKKTTFKDANKTSSQNKSSISMSKSSSCSSSSSTSSNPYAVLPRPPSKKGWNGGSYYGGNNGVRISPVLNVPSPYISKGTAKLFCLGSFLHPGKDQKVKK